MTHKQSSVMAISIFLGDMNSLDFSDPTSREATYPTGKGTSSTQKWLGMGGGVLLMVQKSQTTTWDV